MSGEMARAEVTPEGAAPGFGADLYAQATKALSLRTPFEGEEAASRVPTLPARLVSWAGTGDARKKHKKIQLPPPDDAAVEPPPPAAAKVGLWEQFEAYFRPVTLADVEMLKPKLPFGYSNLDSCMLIPFLGSGNEFINQAETYDVAVAETSSYLGVGGAEVVSSRERGEQSAHLLSHKEKRDQSVDPDIHDVVVQQMVSDKDLRTCRAAFHPICARDSKHQMEIWGKSGHSNVELRAFCSKHSATGYTGSQENSNHASGQSPIESAPNNADLISGKIPKLRFTRKNKDKFINSETSASSSGNLIRVETIEQDALAYTVRNANAQLNRSWETDTWHPSVEHMSSEDIAVVLRKLIDSGKVSVGDIASDLGISSESLEAALVGETTTFSHGLMLKIIKWLKNSVHMHAVQGNSHKGNSLVLQDNNSDGSDTTDAVNVRIPLVPDDDKDMFVDALDSSGAEATLARSKSNTKTLEDDNTTCATAVTILQNGNKNMLKDGADPECSTEAFAKESTREFSPIGSKGVSKEEKGKLILNNTSGNKEFGTSMEIPNENRGILLGRKSDNLTEAGPCSGLKEGLSSLDHCSSQGDYARDGENLIENGFGTPRDCDSNCSHVQPFFKEAKKRGRKEKRHKEAQAVLAAAAAAVASSSRNSNMRKDAKEDLAPAILENSPKLVGSSRVGQRPKDPSKSSNSKVPQDNRFGSFHMPISKENALYCDVCMRTETVLNRIFICSRCKAAVHIDCYRNLENSIGPWKCELCEDQDISIETSITSDKSDCNGKELPFARCSMCHGTSGAFRKTTGGQWVHAFCAEWLLETNYVRGQENPVEGVESLVEGKDTCCLCLRKVGMCLRCSSGDCHITFHPTCARNSGFYMNTKGFGSTFQHKAYCGKHSAQQKEDDAQLYGPEELRNMKRMRVSISYVLYIDFLSLVNEHITMQQREMFQKELVMTSDQASTQNQRLPKGYVYVPRDSLSKERPLNRNTQPHTPQEPGG
nr:unnamed protein product [Digitaria exilis]